MSLLLVLLIVLAVVSLGGGTIRPAYRGPGWGLGSILIVVLLVLLLTGRLG